MLLRHLLAAAVGAFALMASAVPSHATARHHHHHATKHAHHHHRAAPHHRYAHAAPRVHAARAVQAEIVKAASSDAPWVSIAHQHMGASGSIVGMARLWCGSFIRLVMRQSGHPDLRDGNLAMAWRHYGTPTAPRPGAIAVMPRRGGGHVGIVERVDGGRVTIVSGNSTGRRVAVGTYPMSRFVAFRWPA